MAVHPAGAAADGADRLCHRARGVQAAAHRPAHERDDLGHRRQLHAAKPGAVYHRRPEPVVSHHTLDLRFRDDLRRDHQDGHHRHAVSDHTAGGGAGDEGGDAGAAGENGDDKKSPIDDGSHEDDPDFTQGQADSDDVTLSKNPAGKMMYDTEKVMQTVMSVIQTLKDDQLVEIEKVKTAIELVFNGKKLNEEDLEFTNLKNAIFLIKKIGAKLDTKHRLYLYRKIKEPLIQKRDQIKQDIAVKKGQLQNAREVLTAMDVK